MCGGGTMKRVFLGVFLCLILLACGESNVAKRTTASLDSNEDLNIRSSWLGFPHPQDNRKVNVTLSKGPFYTFPPRFLGAEGSDVLDVGLTLKNNESHDIQIVGAHLRPEKNVSADKFFFRSASKYEAGTFPGYNV